MTSASSPAGYSSSNSMGPFSTWSPPPYTSLSPDPYSTPSASQSSSSQPSNTPSFDCQGGSNRGYGQLDAKRYQESGSASSDYRRNVCSTTGPRGSPGLGLSTWSSSEAGRDRGMLVAYSPEKQPVHGCLGSLGSFGKAPCAPQLENIGGAMENQFGPVAVRPTSFEDSRAGAGVEKEVDGGDHNFGGSYQTRLPYQPDGCSRQSFGSEQDMGDRLTCLIDGCRTKKAFRNQQAFEAHLRNVHCYRLWRCPEDRCSLVFNNRTDLKRHKQSIHDNAKPYRCQRPNCRARAKAFSRKDKLKEHDRKHHSNFKCWFCSLNLHFEQWFEHEQELWDHTNKEHPIWPTQNEQYSPYPPLSPSYLNYGHPSHPS